MEWNGPTNQGFMHPGTGLRRTARSRPIGGEVGEGKNRPAAGAPSSSEADGVGSRFSRPGGEGLRRW